MFLGYFTRHTIEASTGIFRTPFAIASIGFLSFWALLEKRENINIIISFKYFNFGFGNYLALSAF
jgi:hypothetical protein